MVYFILRHVKQVKLAFVSLWHSITSYGILPIRWPIMLCTQLLLEKWPVCKVGAVLKTESFLFGTILIYDNVYEMMIQIMYSSRVTAQHSLRTKTNYWTKCEDWYLKNFQGKTHRLIFHWRIGFFSTKSLTIFLLFKISIRVVTGLKKLYSIRQGNSFNYIDI